MSSQSKIFYSSGIAFVGQGASLLFTFLASILIARGLGETAFGQFTFLVSLLNVVALIPDFGLNWTLQRELSRIENGARITGTAFLIRLFLFVTAVVVLNGFFYFFSLEENLWLLANIIVLNIALSGRVSGLRLVLESPYRAEMRLMIPMSLGFLDNMLLVCLLWFAPRLASGLEGVVYAYTAANIPGFVVLLFLVQRERKISFRPQVNEIKKILTESTPLALYTGLCAVHVVYDVFVLKGFWGNDAVGQYGVALRLFLPFVFVPNAFVLGTFPIFSRWFAEEPGRIKQAFQLSMKFMIGVGLTIMVVMVLFSEAIIHLLFGGEFENAIALLQILSVAHVFWFASIFGSSFITATNQQKWNFWIALSIVTVDIVLNTLAIPVYGNLAAAVTRVFAEFVGVTLMFILTRKYLGKEFWIGVSKLVLGVFGSLVVVTGMGVDDPFLALGLTLAFFAASCILTKPISLAEIYQLRVFLGSSMKSANY